MSLPRRPLLGLETLENRLTPAIDFTASTFGFGTLNLVTDGTATTVSLTLTGANEVLVDDGVTPTTFVGVTSKLVYNGSDAGDAVTFDLDGFTLAAGVWLNTGAGDDAFTVQDTTTGGQLNAVLNINAGDGTNTVDITTLTSISSVHVTAGFGDDTVNANLMDIRGNFWASLGEGENSLTVSGTDVVTVGGSIKYDGGFGTDTVSLGDSALTTVGGSISIVAGDGDNDIDTGLNTTGKVTIGGAFAFTGGAGNDNIFIDSTTAGGSLSFFAGDGDNVLNVTLFGPSKAGVGLFYTGGSGDEVVTIGSGAFPVTFGGAVAINTLDAANGDIVTIGTATSVANIGGSVAVTMGDAGANHSFSMDNAKIKGSVAVNSLGAVNAVIGSAVAVQVNGSLTFRAGIGDDAFDFGAALGTKVNGSMSVQLGEGANLWAMANDFYVGGNLSLASGTGDDLLALFATTAGQVRGNLTVNLGHGLNDFTLNGSVGTATTGGQFTYGGGNDADNVTVNGRVFRQLTARLQGGDDLFTYGAGSFVGNPFINRRGTAYVNGGLGNNLFTNNGPAFLNLVTRRVRMV